MQHRGELEFGFPECGQFGTRSTPVKCEVAVSFVINAFVCEPFSWASALCPQHLHLLSARQWRPDWSEEPDDDRSGMVGI